METLKDIKNEQVVLSLSEEGKILNKDKLGLNEDANDGSIKRILAKLEDKALIHINKCYSNIITFDIVFNREDVKEELNLI